MVWIRRRRWRVERARRYKHVVRLDVAGRDGRCTFLAPFDRIGAAMSQRRPRRVRPQAFVGRLAAWLGRAASVRSLGSAVDAAIDILPFQLEPALALGAGTRRVLIADAVGLGKTIQAGLAIAELHRRDPAARTLVLVPAALRAQWAHELRAHFTLDVVLADAGGLGQLARSLTRQETPWERPGVWLGSIDYLKQPHVLAGAIRRPWDLLVVDEAHGVCGSSERHAAAEALARRSRRVMLLTATPHAGDRTRFDRLVDLGALSQAGDALLAFRRTRAALGLRTERRVRWHSVPLTPEESRVLSALGEFEGAVLRGSDEARRPGALLLLSVFRKRALSTMSALGRTIDRRLAALDRCAAAEPSVDAWRQARLTFETAEDTVAEDEQVALHLESGLGRDVERSWLRRLRELVCQASSHESKVQRIRALAARTTEPLAVFTEFRDSLDILLPRLLETRSVAVLHGGMSQPAMETELERFLSGEASALLATDVASQGLNLQSRCRWVLSLELPWNPARIEQRAGRVDRIGQRRPVHIGLLVARHDAEAGLLARLARRTLAAQRSLGTDILCLTAPDERLIRAHLLAGDAADLDGQHAGASDQTVEFCRTWSRAARQQARRLARRRGLIRQWRADPATGRPCRARLDRVPVLRSSAGGGVLLFFSVPLADGSGVVIEWRQVGLRIPGADVRRVLEDASAITAARHLAAAMAESRARRLRRWLWSEAERNSFRERAIADASGGRQELQPGLFDRRAARANDAAAAAREQARLALDDRLAFLDAGARLTVGVPVLEFAAGPEQP
jgi:superfamily II DNA or RNA helicase